MIGQVGGVVTAFTQEKAIVEAFFVIVITDCETSKQETCGGWGSDTSPGARRNTLILDCEGCYVDFLAENFERFRDQLDKIILENDHNNVTQTQMFVQVLESFGFRKDKKATTGVLNGLGSILVFTKSK